MRNSPAYLANHKVLDGALVFLVLGLVEGALSWSPPLNFTLLSKARSALNRRPTPSAHRARDVDDGGTQ
jgi:hypothetical protein